MDTANAGSVGSPPNRNSLAQRWASAFVLVPLLLVMIVWSRWSLALVVVLAVLLAVRELSAAFAHGGYPVRPWLAAAMAASLVVATALRPVVPDDVLPAALALVLIASRVLALARHDRAGALGEWAFSLAGGLYLGGLLRYLVLLRDITAPLGAGWLPAGLIEPGAAWLIMVMAVTWGSDAFAYFAGHRFGRHRMTPGLSPKKTWEGAIGGFIGAVALGGFVTLLFGLPVTPLAGALIGAVAGIAGPFGDLAESFVKRQVGLKDAGSLIPGHGGILDRIDSLLFAAPLAYYAIIWHLL
ncbi:MAG: phosphatidate cytidylyltransferase [Chloroflexi bacterium]|jgi:phosphatidate cytidylyltransferase|nr:phosphatidate cytidylyltransferase [Chloroflexota bacterium]